MFGNATVTSYDLFSRQMITAFHKICSETRFCKSVSLKLEFSIRIKALLPFPTLFTFRKKRAHAECKQR